MGNTLFCEKEKRRAHKKLRLSIFWKKYAICCFEIQILCTYLHYFPFTSFKFMATITTSSEKISQSDLNYAWKFEENTYQYIYIYKRLLKHAFYTVPAVNLRSFTNSSWPWRQAITAISNTTIRMWTNNSNWSRSRGNGSGIFTIGSTSWPHKWTNFLMFSRGFHCTENTSLITI